MIITIDGPTASGKSTVARTLATKLKIHHLSTGLLYRGLAYLLTTLCDYTNETINEPSLDDVEMLLNPDKFSYFENEQGKGCIAWDGKDITAFLKSAEMDQAASLLSTNPMVRDHLLEYQRWFGKQNDIIADGRDLGSVVYPDADVKFFVTATPEVRAKRWQEDQKRLGNDFTLEQALEQVNSRDERDRKRAVCPLIQPKDSIIIDTSDLSPEQTVDAMLAIVEQNQS